MNKAEKVAFVKALKKELKEYKACAVMPTSSTPDRLVQKVRNQLKPGAKFVVARKTLLLKAFEGDENYQKLAKYVDGNVALILTNKDPSELNAIISANRIKLSAKPNQISPQDINIDSGETMIAPGQAVTDLKSAGIDVQIQKGKVVISKSKTLVKKGAKITTAVSKALKMLDILPFEAKTTLSAVLEGGLLYTEQALGINPAYLQTVITQDFSAANALTLQIGYVTPYNAELFIRKAYLGALGLGVERGIYEPDIVEKLIAKAVLGAVQANKLVKAPEASAAPAADAPNGDPAADEKKE